MQRQFINSAITDSFLGEIDDPFEQTRVARLVHDTFLLKEASMLAVRGALQHGVDFPVAAVVAIEGTNEIVGEYIASDRRLRDPRLHAEVLALADAALRGFNPSRDMTLAVNMEPCQSCQDHLERNRIGRVVFSTTRAAVHALGLVRNKGLSILERATANSSPVEVNHIKNQALDDLNMVLFRATQRDLATEDVQIDREQLLTDLTELGVIT